MPALTLAYLRQTLWNYASNVAYADRTPADTALVDGAINQLAQRLLSSGKVRGSLARATFAVYDQQITLPDTLDTILGATPVNASGENAGRPLGLFAGWHEFATGGVGKLTDSGLGGLIDLGEGWPGFRSPAGTFYIKAQSTQNETTRTILLRGVDANGDTVYSSSGTVEGVSLALDDTAATTSQAFTRLDYWVKSAATAGVVRLYAVDTTTAAETLFAIIAPGKLVSSYRRYKLPVPGFADLVEVIAKRAFVPAVADHDPVIPGHLGAFKLGLMSLQFEDRNDLERAAQYMARALELLDEDRAEFDGDSQRAELQVLGDFGAGSIFNTM